MPTDANLPLMVYGEAAVISRFAGKPNAKTGKPNPTSILDKSLDPTQFTIKMLKACYADPEVYKKATLLLKKKGFFVSSMSKFSINISAPPKVYEDVFNINLVGEKIVDADLPTVKIAVTVKQNSQRPTIIETNNIDEFKDLLDGISIIQPSFCPPSNFPPEQTELSDWIFPEQVLNNQLGKVSPVGELYTKEQTKLTELIMIDSGCYLKHSYFKDAVEENRINVQISPTVIDEFNREINKEKNIIRYMRETFNEKDVHTQKALNDRHAKINQLIEECNNYKDKTHDPNGHGTHMVAQALGIIPEARIRLIKLVQKFPTPWELLLNEAKNLRKSKAVISLSMSGDSNSHKVVEIPANVPVFVASGNADVMQITDLVKLPRTITIGGAFRQESKVIASDATRAHVLDVTTTSKKRVPFICGWACKNGERKLMVPTTPKSANRIEGKNWTQINGASSAATVQVAAIYALLRVMFKSMNNQTLLGILYLSADPIKDGSFTGLVWKASGGGKKLVNIPESFDGFGEIGLVNFERILAEAHLVDWGISKTNYKEELMNELNKWGGLELNPDPTIVLE